MGLDNIPLRTRDANGEEREPVGYTHERGEPCPFRKLNQPRGIMGTCCWLRGAVAERELEALGRTALAERMYRDMQKPDEVRAFAAELDRAATDLEHEHADDTEKPRGAGWNGTWNEDAKAIIWQDYSTFDEAIAAIRMAARWYKLVARLGYGVHAWY